METDPAIVQRLVDVASLKRLGPHKGTNGRLLIVGGSDEYVGAPYFAAKAAMIMGIDLVHIWTISASASASLKVLLPDAIVTYRQTFKEFANELLGPFDTILIGCGLGRDRAVEKWEFLVRTIAVACEEHKFVVLDGDALWMCAQSGLKPSLHELPPGPFYPVVMTPNPVELKRLKDMEDGPIDLWPDQATLKGRTFGRGGPILGVFEKREPDMVHIKAQHVPLNYGESQKGCPRRFGGQGDFLAGCLAALLAMILSDKRRPEPLLYMTKIQMARTACVFSAAYSGLTIRNVGITARAHNTQGLLEAYGLAPRIREDIAAHVFQHAISKIISD